MNAIVDKTLSLWGLTSARYTLVAERENAVYQVETPTDLFALRLHRQDYRTNDELDSELHWMKAVGDGGLSVPDPIPSKTGGMMHVVDGVQVDVLNWLAGDTLDTILNKSNTKTRAAFFQSLGQDMARLHDICDAWQPPSGFSRCAWNIDGLLGDAPLWDRFWDNPDLTAKDRNLFNIFRQKARADLDETFTALDYGLIHADLVTMNVMVNGTDLHFIDFDDGGYGFRVFELATALLKHIDAPDYFALKQALLDGYKSLRTIDLSSLDLFMALRATTYVGWNITRLNEDGGAARNARFINTAKTLAVNYLS